MKDIDKYINQKYIDFKFPLLKSVEEEVKALRNKIASSGRIGGQLVSGPYRIRKNYVEKLFIERVSLEINTRIHYGITMNDDEYSNILKNILNLIDHEYELLISATREDANLAHMDKSTFENSFLETINSDLNNLKDSIKRKLEIGKFEIDRIEKVNINNKPQIYDAFLCHANEDKEEIADDLFLELTKKGKNIWYDDFTLELGDSLREKIDEGLKQSNYGIVIFSKNFFNKQWPKAELNGLFDKEISLGRKVILPIWHNITKEEIQKESHVIADRYAIPTSHGSSTVVKKILEVLNIDKSKYISNSDDITNEIQAVSSKKIENSSKKDKYIFLFSKSNSFIEAQDATISLFKYENEFTKDDILKIANISINNDQILNSFGARKILQSFFKRYSEDIPFAIIKKFFNN